MDISRTVHRLVWTAGLTTAAAVLIWLVFGVAGAKDNGVTLLANTDQGRVERVADARPDATIEEVRAWPESTWTPWKENGFLTARHGDVIWLRVTLKNPGSEPLNGVVENTSYFSDVVEAWTEHPNGWRRMVSGTATSRTC